MPIRINSWKGLVNTASPYVLPPGAAVEQINCTSLTPGQLTVRGGSQKLADTSERLVELWGLSLGSSQTDVILGQSETGKIVELGGIGGTPTEAPKSNAFTGDHPVSFSQGRRGEVYIYQGYGKRGLVRGPDGVVRPVGLSAPEAKPEITQDSSPSYYVARVDITEVGNGYNLPPTVKIGAPTGDGGRQATALSRILGARVNEIEVLDGGAGYTEVPCVEFTDTPNGPATGVGAAAAITLEAGAAQGDPETGIVYWEVSELPTWFWLCLQGYAREGKGIIVNAEGGSGSGARAIVWVDGTLYNGNCLKQNSDGSELNNFGVNVQVYDFGSGYSANDIVTGKIKVAGQFTSGIVSGPNCNTEQECQLRIEGITRYSPKAPGLAEIIRVNPYKQRRIKTNVDNGGSGYKTPPTFTTEDGEIIKTEINCKGSVTKLIVPKPNKVYLFPPKLIDPEGDVGKARALAIVRPNFRGKYQCYYRYVNDSVPESAGGPIYSSLSPVNELDCGDCASKIIWASIKIPAGSTGVELWRSTAGQATTLFRVATLKTAADYEDSLSDRDLTDTAREGYLQMPILLEDGSLNANRFGVASPDFAVGVVFQDRTFLGVDTTGKRPNTLLYSEADEPEAVPEVNELILQTNVRDTDYITALIPYAGALVVAQSKHIHRLTFVRSPEQDATTSLIAYRGCLNQRCWDIYMGLAYILDDNGLYSMTDTGEVEHLSMAIDSMFRLNTDASLKTIDFNKREWFFLRADRNFGVIRIHVAYTGDEGKYPTRQLVYDPDSKAMWEEEYPTVFSAATEIRADDGSVMLVHAAEDRLLLLGSGLTDEGKPIAYSYRSGNFEFGTDQQSKNGGQQSSRNVSVVYKPTKASSRLNLAVFYNGSSTPRRNVARRDRGVGFIHDDQEPAAYVDMQAMPHQEAESHGIARALFAGKTLEDFAGSDTHVSIKLYGEQDEAGPVVIHSVDLMGVNGGE